MVVSRENTREGSPRQAHTREPVLYRTPDPDCSSKKEVTSVKQQKADRRSQRTYRLVSSAFAELLVEKPYEEILVQAILDRAGTGRTTFYAHYFDKQAPLSSIPTHPLKTFTHQTPHSPP